MFTSTCSARCLTFQNKIVWFQKISILPPQKGLEIPGRRGVSKSPKFKAMYEAKLEFLERWGVKGQIPSVWGMDIFWNHTLSIIMLPYECVDCQGGQPPHTHSTANDQVSALQLVNFHRFCFCLFLFDIILT